MTCSILCEIRLWYIEKFLKNMKKYEKKFDFIC